MNVLFSGMLLNAKNDDEAPNVGLVQMAASQRARRCRALAHASTAQPSVRLARNAVH